MNDQTESGKIRREIYERKIDNQAARLLSLIDRETFSPTRGCMDRTYWAWKFTDFPGARFQEGVCALAYLWSSDIGSTQYQQNEQLLSWIESAIRFWMKIQRSSGDFDEAYPFERSLAATSFSTFYLAEGWLMLRAKGALSHIEDEFLDKISKSATWLCQNDEKHGFLSNHLAAAAGALLHASQLCSEKGFAMRANYFIEKILSHQSSEGWYEEYGGPDPGYQTHGSFYLARCSELQPDHKLRESLRSGNRFAAHFVHPDLSYSGEYASRNTQTYYPAAYEMAAEYCGSAAWICETMCAGLSENRAAGLDTVDIYNFFPMLNNYVFAHRAVSKSVSSVCAEGPAVQRVKYFPEAGILKVQTDGIVAFVGTKKGGVIKVFDRSSNELILSDCGLIGRMQSGQVVSNQFFQDELDTEVDGESTTITGGFFTVSRPVMEPFRFIGFRLFSMSVGRFKKISYWLKALLVKFLIYRKVGIALECTRRITWTEEGLQIDDEIWGADLAELETLHQGEAFTTIHMGSSRYFVPNELRLDLLKPVNLIKGQEKLVLKRRVSVVDSRPVAQV